MLRAKLLMPTFLTLNKLLFKQDKAKEYTFAKFPCHVLTWLPPINLNSWLDKSVFKLFQSVAKFSQ